MVYRKKFIAGLIILIPMVITVKALWWLFTYVDSFARPLLQGLGLSEQLIGKMIPGTGFVITIAIVFLTGLMFSSGPLHRLLEGLEDVFETVPLVGTFYATVRKVLSGFGGDGSREAFKRFVFARLPGRTSPGFLTGSFTLRRRDGSSQLLCSVYIPTNHLYIGDVVLLPVEDVIETDLSVEDGISVILSAGAAMPGRVGEPGEAAGTQTERKQPAQPVPASERDKPATPSHARDPLSAENVESI